MSITSREGARFAATLGVSRVVVGRELSIQEITRMAAPMAGTAGTAAPAEGSATAEGAAAPAGLEAAVGEAGAAAPEMPEVEAFVHGALCGEHAVRAEPQRRKPMLLGYKASGAMERFLRKGLESSTSMHLRLPACFPACTAVSYSGQCFSSEAWGGRSANRGQCAQVRTLTGWLVRVAALCCPAAFPPTLLSPPN